MKPKHLQGKATKSYLNSLYFYAFHGNVMKRFKSTTLYASTSHDCPGMFVREGMLKKRFPTKLNIFFIMKNFHAIGCKPKFDKKQVDISPFGLAA